MTAGTRPLRRDSRAVPFPARSRASALTLSTAAMRTLLQVSQLHRANHSRDDRWPPGVPTGFECPILGIEISARKGPPLAESLIEQARDRFLFADPRHR